MKVLITGAQGQLGYDLNQVLLKHHLFLGNQENCDITNKQAIERVFAEFQPEVVIHAAAYTGVDQAEIDRKKCYKINVEGTKNIAQECQKNGSKLVYISTDYVFDGNSNHAYKENDLPHPVNYYGLTKYQGEKTIQSNCSKYFIIRTAWLYGINGNNFVKTISKKAKFGDDLKVVVDQIGNPTFTKDLSYAIVKLITTENFGIWHIVNSGSCSWYEFAKAILKKFNIKSKIVPIESHQINQLAKRPKYSVLNTNKFVLKFGPLRSWQEALDDFMKEMKISK